MTCGCEKQKPKGAGKNFTKAVVEINNPSKITLLRKVIVPASLGDETTMPPVIGKYCNVVLYYEASKAVYLYSSDGIPTLLTTDTSEIEQAIEDLQSQVGENTSDITILQEGLSDEITYREDADIDLQRQIDAISASSDVKDIVGTYAELQNYDTSTLSNNDIIKVLQDETQDDATTYYRWNATTSSFSLIGEEGPYYTKSETDVLLSDKQDTLTAGTNVNITNNVISATDTTYSAGTGLDLTGTEFSVDNTVVAFKTDLPTVNNGIFKIQKNGTDVASFTANSATDVTANITVPTNNNELTNGAGYQTANDVATAISGKQDTLTAGTNISISGTTISATDTTYSAGNGISLTGTVFSADTDVLQTKLTAGTNIDITNGVISSDGPTYTAGSGLDLTGNEFSVDTSVVALKTDIPTISTATLKIQKNGTDVATFTTNDPTPVTANITVPTNNNELTNGAGYQTANDVQTLISGKQDTLTAGTNIQINGTTISATDTKYTAGTGLTLTGTVFYADTTVLATQTDLSGKQDTLTAGSNITITGSTISATDTTYSDFTGADAGTAGTNGLVPAPAAGDNTKFLSGDGTWKTVSIYNLPIASANTLGGIKVGSNLTIDPDTGVLSADAQPATLYSSTGQNTDGAMTQKATTDALAGKQDSLTAGTNITITSNTVATSAAEVIFREWS